MPSLSVWSRAAEHLPPPWLEALPCPRRWIDAPHWACLQFGFRHFPISAWSAQGLRRGTKEINTCSSSSWPCLGVSSPEPSPPGTLAPRLCCRFCASSWRACRFCLDNDQYHFINESAAPGAFYLSTIPISEKKCHLAPRVCDSRGFHPLPPSVGSL